VSRPDAPAPHQVCPPLSDDEFAALKADIATRGVLVPVECDEAGNVLDGHHRLRACRELGVAFWPRVVRAGLSEAEKRQHARTLNLARRHLTSEQKRALVADQLRDTPAMADRAVAEGLRVDHKTVGAVRDALERAGEIPQGLRDRNGCPPRPIPVSTWRVSQGAPGVATAWSGETEWFTPPEILGAARAVLGGFDLDPASHDMAQRSVRAARHHTRSDDGLAQPWSGRVWLNPPYGAALLHRFVDKLVGHVAAGDVRAAILLVDNRTDTEWFHRAAAACARICLTRGRVRFLTPEGEAAASPTNGSALFYFGDNPAAFEEVFGALGLVVRPARPWARAPAPTRSR